MLTRHIGPPFATMRLITGARHVHLIADDDLGEADLYNLIDELERAGVEAFGRRRPESAAVLDLTA